MLSSPVAGLLFFDPTGQNPSISIKETANVYKLDKRKEKREFERQKAYNLLSQISPNSQPAAKEPTATQGRDLPATSLPDQLRQNKKQVYRIHRQHLPGIQSIKTSNQQKKTAGGEIIQ
jgi:hypothetical protein